MRVIDQDTGKQFNLDRTPEFLAEIAPVDTPCDHSRRELRQRLNKGGAVQYIEQCLRCGESVGLFRKHTPDLVGTPAWNEQLEEEFYAARKRDRDAIIQKHVRIQRGRSEGFWREYNLYLKSEDWRRKSAKVLRRANGQCEGCGAKAASQAHHLTYKNVFAEFLFELVAVCDDCHKRLHAVDEPPGDEQAEIGESLCCDCRWQTEHQGKVWCGMFDTAAKDALAESGECGPQRSAFEPLK